MVKTKIGDLFQQETKYQRGHLPGGDLDWESQPATYKSSPSAPRIQLSYQRRKAGRPSGTRSDSVAACVPSKSLQ